MDLISELFSGSLGSLLVLTAVFVGVVGLVLAIFYFTASRPDLVKERLQRTVNSVTSGARVEAVSTAEEKPKKTGGLRQMLRAMTSIARPKKEIDLGRLRNRLSYAGFRKDQALTAYLMSQIVLCVALGVAVVWYHSRTPQPLEKVGFYTVLAMAVGFYLPPLWLSGRIKERQSKINRSLPNALDLTVTCVEAGLALDASLDRVANEIELSSSILASELNQTSLEIRAGITRGDAFRRLARRTGVEELSNMAAIIIQTETFGTSIAHALRVLSEAMRVRRMQVAEERAATVGVKLTIPLILCILPALFVVLAGPAVVQIFRVLLPSLAGD